MLDSTKYLSALFIYRYTNLLFRLKYSGRMFQIYSRIYYNRKTKFVFHYCNSNRISFDEHYLISILSKTTFHLMRIILYFFICYYAISGFDLPILNTQLLITKLSYSTQSQCYSMKTLRLARYWSKLVMTIININRHEP